VKTGAKADAQRAQNQRLARKVKKSVYTETEPDRFLSMKATINYTLPSGRTATIIIEPIKFWDGTVYAEVSAAVDGVGSPIIGGRTVPAGLPAWAVSAIGKLPLTADADAQVAAAVAAIDAQYATHNALAAAHIAELESISDSTRRITRRMAC